MGSLACEICDWEVVMDEPLPDGRVYDGQDGRCSNCGTPGFVSCCSETAPSWVSSSDEGNVAWHAFESAVMLAEELKLSHDAENEVAKAIIVLRRNGVTAELARLLWEASSAATSATRPTPPGTTSSPGPGSPSS